jgi:serine/threonine-protein kinase
VAGKNDGDPSKLTPPGGVRAPSGRDMPALGTLLGGRFQLEETLGKGGSGVVFRAFDRVMGEPVAVKLLYPERAADQAWIRRLVREVKVARTIVHPNVRRIFEIGQVDGYWLITMELGAGSLGERMRTLPHGDEPRRRPLPPWSERRDDARAVIDGLAAIHAAEIVHRDVTPANILRMNDGRLVLSDFGLALLDGETTGFVAGTPKYVAPEVLAGARADQRSDVWQLGLVLHEIVFERRARWRADGAQELLPPPVEDEETPRGDLLRILGLCLNVDPKERAASAIEIAESFEGATTSRFGARRRARRRRVFGFGAGLLAAAGVAAATHPQWERWERGERREAPNARPQRDPQSAPAAAAAPTEARVPPPTVSKDAVVHIRLRTRPPRARVVDVATSEVWGTTPLDLDREASSRTFTLRFERPRFEPTVITIGGDRDLTETIELRPRRESGAAAEKAAGPAPPAPATATPPDEPEKL